MLFNSLGFLLFFPLVFLLYWFVFNKNLKVQNLFLLVCSYYFYSCWDWRFLFLLMTSTLIDYYFGLAIHNKEGFQKKLFLWLSIFNNLVILGFFKYYNFFTLSTQNLLHHLGFEIHPYLLSIALPVGISFYTFHGMSYVFDIYYKKTKPVSSFVDYAVFVCFFPLLVAGPIERATHLLPQVVVKRFFNYEEAKAGLRLVLWGFFKKVVIADSTAPLVNSIFNAHHTMSGLSLVIGMICFGFQAYGDFGGYSDIARGTAKLLGFDLIINFNFPFYAKSISEFWRRWHMSLNTWFMDYLYMPITIALRNYGKRAIFIGLFVTFFLSGLWHGPSWNYILFGVFHGIALIFEIRTAKARKKLSKKMPIGIFNFFGRIITFAYVLFTWVFFRARSAHDGANYLTDMFTRPFIIKPEYKMYIQYMHLPLLFIFLYMVDWINRDANNISPFFDKIKQRPVRYGFYLMLVLFILLFGTFNKTAFIYFQF